ncbi:MAG: hypothetical protein ACJ8BF_04235, partial [Gemmatimonadales bacterium]
LFMLEMLVGGGVLGATLFGCYLGLSSKDHGCHINEVFSSQRIADRKNFLRLMIDAKGTLTIHPIGVPIVPKGREWVARETLTGPDQSVVDPRDKDIPITRIEDPITCC